MKKLLLGFAFLLGALIPAISFGAISFGNAAGLYNGGSGPSVTQAITINSTSTNVMILAGVSTLNSGSDVLTSVTWNGNAMTRVNIRCSNQCVYIYYYVLASGDGASHNVVATASSGNDMLLGVSFYNNVAQVVPEANSTNMCSSCTSLSSSVTTIANNAWVIGFERDQNATTGAGTNTTKIGTIGTDLFHSSLNPISPPALTTIQSTNNGGAGSVELNVVSIAPFATPASGPTRRIKGAGISR